MSDEPMLVIWNGDEELGRLSMDQARQLLDFVENDMVQREGVAELANEIAAWLIRAESQREQGEG